MTPHTHANIHTYKYIQQTWRYSKIYHTHTYTQRETKSHTTQTSLETFISQDEWIMDCLGIYNAANEIWAPWNLVVGIIILPLGCQGVKLGHSVLELLWLPAPLWSWAWPGMCSVVDGFPSGSHGSAGHILKGWPLSHHVSLVVAVILSVRITVLLSFSSCRLGGDLLPSKAAVIV